MITRRKW